LFAARFLRVRKAAVIAKMVHQLNQIMPRILV